MARTALNTVPRSVAIPVAKTPRGPTQAFDTRDVKIEQKPDVDMNKDERDGDVLTIENVMPEKRHMDLLAFNEEPVTIRLQASSDKNASTRFFCSVNGKGAEILMNGKWAEVTWLPIGPAVTTKRKYVEVIARAKIDNITHRGDKENTDDQQDNVRRRTSSLQAFSVIEDNNPRGAAWLTSILASNA